MPRPAVREPLVNELRSCEIASACNTETGSASGHSASLARDLTRIWTPLSTSSLALCCHGSTVRSGAEERRF